MGIAMDFNFKYKRLRLNSDNLNRVWLTSIVYPSNSCRDPRLRIKYSYGASGASQAPTGWITETSIPERNADDTGTYAQHVEIKAYGPYTYLMCVENDTPINNKISFYKKTYDHTPFTLSHQKVIPAAFNSIQMSGDPDTIVSATVPGGVACTFIYRFFHRNVSILTTNSHINNPTTGNQSMYLPTLRIEEN